MKKVALFLAVIGLFSMAGTSYAGFDFDEIDQYQEIVMADAPRLVALAPDWYAGASLAKDINGTTSNEGWAVIGKVTYTGTLFNLGGFVKEKVGS